MPGTQGLVWTALIAAGVLFAYHKGYLPGMKDPKKVTA